MALGIKKAGGPIWPSGSLRCVVTLRQVKKGTDLPRSVALIGATNRSMVAAELARFLRDICVQTLLCLVWRGERDREG